MIWVMLASGMFLLALLVNEALKKVGQARPSMLCPVCLQKMQAVSNQYNYAPPAPVLWTLGRYKLPLSHAQKYLCRDRHSYMWHVSPHGDLKFEVTVTGLIKS